jgi:hypothetical protein
MSIVLGFSLPQGAQANVINGSVSLDPEWRGLITLAAPNTPGHYRVWTVGPYYLPRGKGHSDEEFVLLNYPQGRGNWKDTIAWAVWTGQLEKTLPQDVFGIGQQYPALNQILGSDRISLVETTGCILGLDHRACGIWWRGSCREAGLGLITDFYSARHWFLFRRRK